MSDGRQPKVPFVGLFLPLPKHGKLGVQWVVPEYKNEGPTN